ncbi:hypothetical protein RJ639_009175 [Escallonia herrerae]|uniref:Retrotransposon gag domain-containing protein n=1 Tax=Escallonia herrerae TaxID=1293975 RepID=A0AA89ATN7_9ASTE|nr:hypothetical protein RJ639_009175 [Escallonia herrerae]
MLLLQPRSSRKATHAWFKSLQLRSIHSFAQLSDLFQKHSVSSCTKRKNSTSLLNVMQEKNESLSNYLWLDRDLDVLSWPAIVSGKEFFLRRNDSRQEPWKCSHEDSLGGKKNSKRSKWEERRPNEMPDMKNLTPLNTRPSQILHEIRDTDILDRPNKIRSALSMRDRNLWS